MTKTAKASKCKFDHTCVLVAARKNMLGTSSQAKIHQVTFLNHTFAKQKHSFLMQWLKKC